MTMKMEKKAQIQKYQQEELTRYENWLNMQQQVRLFSKEVVKINYQMNVPENSLVSWVTGRETQKKKECLFHWIQGISVPLETQLSENI